MTSRTAANTRSTSTWRRRWDIDSKRLLGGVPYQVLGEELDCTQTVDDTNRAFSLKLFNIPCYSIKTKHNTVSLASVLYSLPYLFRYVQDWTLIRFKFLMISITKCTKNHPQFCQIWSNMKISNNPDKYEVLIKQYLRSILNISVLISYLWSKQ